MDSFLRALQFTMPYRTQLLLSMGCMLVVAVLWSANIGATWPLLRVLLENQSLADWVQESIENQQQAILQANQEIQEQVVQIQQLKAKLASVSAQSPAGRELHSEIHRRQHEQARRERERARREDWLSWAQWGKPILVQYTPTRSFHTLCLIMAIILISLVIKGIFSFFQAYLAGIVVQRAMFDLRHRLFYQTLNLDVTYFSDQGTHELIAKLTNDLESLTNGIRALFGKVLLEPLKAICCLLLLFWINWRLTLFTLALFPLGAALMGILGRYLKRLSRKNLESAANIYKILQESFQGVRVVKAFTMERYERQRLFREAKRYYRQSLRLIRTDALMSPIMELLAMCAIASALLVGSYLVMEKTEYFFQIKLTEDPLDASTLFVFYGLIAGMCDPIRKGFNTFGRVQRGIAASERLMQLLDRESQIKEPAQPILTTRHQQSIEFKDVTFGYALEHPVLRNIHLKIAFGERIAIVGVTGCGKTSLINLLPRFYDPQTGVIEIDEVDIRNWSLKNLREQMGIVTQHTVLFDDTIFNNIRYGSPHATAAEVEAAARAASCHAFIEALPDGYATPIGEMGLSLSGGQRQRIALARAMLRKPSILILDEATSSLDVENEAFIHRDLQSFMAGRTILIITHRLNSVHFVDRIVVVDAGQIEAIGTHEELLRSSPTYARLQQIHARSA